MTVGHFYRNRSCRGRERSRQSGFSLAEMVAVMVIMSVLVVAMGSAMVLASRAIPRGTDRNALVIEAGRVSDQIVEELRTATYLTERGTNAMTFTVADRNGDGLPETIRYAWSGTIGDPLTMELNGGAKITVIDNVQQFDLTYDITSSYEQYPGPIIEFPEQVHSSYDPAVNPQDHTLTLLNWVGQTFSASLPPDAVSWGVSRVLFRAKQDGLILDSMVVQLRTANGSSLPTATTLGSVVVLESNLTAGYTWHEVPFSSVNGLAPGTNLSLLLTHIGVGLPAARIQYDGNAGSGRLKSTSAGLSWTYISDEALLYYIYGTYFAPGPDQAVTRQHVSDVRIALHAGDDLNSRVETAARLLNLPEILDAVWEADFSADPTLLDIENDANPDWDMTAGGSFNPATLVNGVWQVDRSLRTTPDYNFTEVTTIDLRFRDTDQGGAGPTANFYVDFGGGLAGKIGATVKLRTNGFQYVNVSFGPGPTIAVIEDVVIEGPLPPGEYVDVRLLIDPVKDTFNVKINGQDKGTFAYSRFPLPRGMFYMDQSGAGSEIDYVRIRVGGAGS